MDSLKTLNLSLLPLSQVFQLARFLGPPSSAAVWVLMCICIGDGNAELGWDHVWMLPHFSWLTAGLEVRCECVCVCVYRGCEQGVCAQCWGVLFVLDSWMFSWYCLGVSENVTSCNVSANISE